MISLPSFNSPPINPTSKGFGASWINFFNQIFDLLVPVSNAGKYLWLAPVAGFSQVIPDGIMSLILEPAGVLATGTVTLPSNPQDGEPVFISSTQVITALTVNAAGTTVVKNAPTTIAAGQGYGFQYLNSKNAWFRIF